MANASLTPIYNRLHSIPAYHPMSADTFADWTMEAGDIVTVSRDGQAYSSPVGTSKLVWRGKQQISIGTTGQKTRPAISKISKKKYGRGGSSIYNNNYIYREITDEYGTLKTTIRATESVIFTEVSNSYAGLTSSITQTASSIRSEVSNSYKGLSSSITQTASSIRAEVSNSYKGLSSSITQTASSIRAEVSNSYKGLSSSITQTASSIRSEVSNSYKGLSSSITQTASSIRSEVSNSYRGLSSTITQTESTLRSLIIANKSSTVYPQYNDPRTSHEIKEGDIWIQTNSIRSWNDFFNADADWSDSSQWDWQEMRGSLIKVWKNGRWEDVSDEQTIATLTDIDQTNDHIALVAKSVETLDGTIAANEARFTVRANQIEAVVYDRTNGLDSRITQTASSIRMEVNNNYAGLSSSITQTASSIRSEVSNSYKGLSSSITQTASSIRSEVSNSYKGLSSSITQTASSIRAEVSNSYKGLSSSITQTASSIRSEVSNSYKGLTSSITQTASSIRAEVSNSYKGLSSSITQTASSIRSEVSNSYKGLTSSITQTASSIRAEVSNSYKGLTSSITQTASSIRAEVSNSYKGLTSSITQTASSIRAEVSNSYAGLTSSITVQANRIGLVVSGTGSSAAIKPAAIVASINDAESTVAISADHVTISGDTKVSGALTITDGNLVVKKTSVFQGNVTLTTSGAYVQAPQFNVPSSGKIQFIGTGTGETYNLTTAILKGMVKSFSVSGNTLTLTPFYGDAVNFSKATSLSGAWGSGTDAGKYIVTASPQGTTLKYDPPMRLNGTTASSNFSAEITETTSGSVVARKSVYGYLIYTANGSSSYVDVNTKSDGTGTNVARISVGSLYTSGQNAVTLNNPSWTYTTPYTSGITNTVTVSTSGRPTQLSKSVPVTLSQGAWSSGSKTVDITTTNGVVVARTTVTAPSTSINTINGAEVGDISTDSDNPFDITASGTNVADKTVKAFVKLGNWNSGKRAINVYMNYVSESDLGTRVARIWVTDPYSKSVTLTYQGSVNGVYTYTTSTYVSGLSTGSRYTMHFNT